MKKNISLDEIQSGMQLAGNIINKYGHVLLGENLIIEEKHIGVLKTWGIKSVDIFVQDVRVIVSEEDILTAREKVLNRLNWFPRNEVEQDLINMAVENIVNKNS